MKLATYSNIGKRTNNEDSVAICDSVVVLCDGVGGISKGEVASSFVAHKIIEKTQEIEKQAISAEWVQNIILQTQSELNESLENYPENYGMGTTLCAVFFAEKEVILAHIGDSRIYYIKPAEEIYWRTTDHSTVAELVQSGIIKEEDAKTHFLSNLITRAIQANPEITPAMADITSVNRIEPGDLVFVCSDGVLESFTDAELLDVLMDKTLTHKTKIDRIENKCLVSSSDNNTAILIEFEKDDKRISDSQAELIWKSFQAKESSPKEDFDTKSTARKKENQAENKNHQPNLFGRVLKVALYTFAILFIAFLTMTLIKK